MIAYDSAAAEDISSSFNLSFLSSYELVAPPADAMGMIELIIDPNVPPTANELIPKKMNTNRRIKIIISIARANARSAGEIPSFSNDMKVFFSLTYLNAFSNSSQFKVSSSDFSYAEIARDFLFLMNAKISFTLCLLSSMPA